MEKYEYFPFIVLYAVFTVSLTYGYEVKQHHIVDDDSKKGLENLIKDSFLNMQHLNNQKFGLSKLDMKDNTTEYAKYQNVVLTRIADTLHDPLYVTCVVDEPLLKIGVPFGFYHVNGSVKIIGGKKNETLPFAMSIDNVFLEFYLKSNDKIEVKMKSDKLHVLHYDSEKNYTEVLLGYEPTIESQILEQFFMQIKKDEFLSHFSTAKNYCFYPQVDAAKQYYSIIENYPIQQNVFEDEYNISDIVVTNFHPSFTLRLYSSEGALFEFRSTHRMDMKFNIYQTDFHDSTPYTARITNMLFSGGSDGRTSWYKSDGYAYVSLHRQYTDGWPAAWEIPQVRLRKIIFDQMARFILDKYHETKIGIKPID